MFLFFDEIATIPSSRLCSNTCEYILQIIYLSYCKSKHFVGNMGGVHNDNQFLSPLKPSDIEEIHFVGSVISLSMEAELGGGVREEHRSSHQICSV